MKSSWKVKLDSSLLSLSLIENFLSIVLHRGNFTAEGFFNWIIDESSEKVKLINRKMLNRFLRFFGKFWIYNEHIVVATKILKNSNP